MAADLPATGGRAAPFGSESWLKLENTPPAWGDKLLQVDVYAWDEKAGRGSRARGHVRPQTWGKGKLWQHTHPARRAGFDTREGVVNGKPALPPGRYLLKVYVDGDGRLAKATCTAALGEADYVGQVEVRGAWKEGYNQMTVADAGKVKL